MEFIKETSAANEQPILKPETEQVHSADASGLNTTSVMQTVSTPYKFSLAPTALEYKIENFVNRWTKIDSGTLSDTDTPLSAVWSGQPIDSLLTNAQMVDKFSHYRYYRGTVEIMLVLSVPGNCSGLYSLSAYPYLKNERNLHTRFTAHQGINGDHWALITMESSTDVVLALPFFSDKDMQPTKTLQRTADYNVFLYCFSPVKSAIPGGPSTASWTLYARFAEDTTFHVPYYLQGAPIYQGKNKKVQKLISHAQKARKDKTLSKTAGIVKDVAQKLSVVPVVGGVAATVASGAKIAEDIFGWLGFSRENAQQQSQHFATRSVSNIVPVTGSDSCDVAGYDVSNAIAIDPEIAGNVAEDQSAFASLAARWTLVDQFEFSATDNPGHLLSRVFVSPGYCMTDAGSNTQHVTTAGYIGMPFSYWRGDAEYLVVVPSAAVHRGTLQVFHAPINGSLNIDPTNLTFNSIFDISESSMAIFKVGYSVNNPMLPLEYWMGRGIEMQGSAAGCLAIRVVNPLQSPNPTDVVRCSVFVRFKNLQFAVPRYNLRLADEANGVFYARWPAALGYQGVYDDDQDIHEVELIPANGIYAVKEIVSGEEVMSARAMMQKPIRVDLTRAPGVDHDAAPIQFGYTRDFPSRRIRTTAFHYGKLFAGVAASQVIRITNCSNDNTGVTCMIVPSHQLRISPFTIRDDVPDTGPFTILGPNKGAEFRIPWYSPNRIKTVNGPGGPQTASDIAQEDNAVFLKTYGHAVIGFYSFGDDIRLGPYMVTPPLHFPDSYQNVMDINYPWLYDPNGEEEE